MKQTAKKRSSKKAQAKAVPVSRFTLLHHRHTGKIMHKRHTSYPVLAMLLLCVGVLLSGATSSTMAATITDSDSYQVTASYLGYPPTTAATIGAPLDGTHFKSAPITVSGTCPVDTYIRLTRNGVPSGIALCNADGTYSLQTDLFSGTNTLQAQVYSLTDLPGPSSAVVTVYLDQPAPVSSPGPTAPRTGTPTSTNNLSMPLILKSQFHYQGHYTGQTTQYQFLIDGGTAPYAVSINWGDGTQKLLTVPVSGPFTVSHTYQKAGGYHGSYKITLSAADAAGTNTMLQILAIVNNRPTVPLTGSASSDGGSSAMDNIGQNLQALLNVIWPTFAITVLLLLAFWFGELRELKLLRAKPGRIHHA